MRLVFLSGLTRLGLAAALVFALPACKQQKAQSASAPRAVPVSVARASQESIPVELSIVGTVEASAIVQIKSQIAGQILSVHFTEGQNVAKDALLFQIDPRPYREALRQAEAAVARDRAQLQQAEATVGRDAAQAKNAESQAARADELFKALVISREQYDQTRTNADMYRESVRASQAAIGSTRATLESDLSAIERAKLDIAYSEIRAPISGRTGNLLVQPGNLVKVNDVPLVVIHKISPIFVNFSVPEQHLAAVRRLNARRSLLVRVSPKDEPGRAAEGHVTVIDNAVDPATGTIHLKAVFDNRDGLLWPGQFVNVVLMLDTIQNATVVPAEAIQAGQQGQFVYVVKPDNTVEPRVVATGRTFERKVVIEKGIAPGDTVITDGQLRLFPGARIQAVAPGKFDSGQL
jgi:membrane fusion protein, multidrug efflux system